MKSNAVKGARMLVYVFVMQSKAAIYCYDHGECVSVVCIDIGRDFVWTVVDVLQLSL